MTGPDAHALRRAAQAQSSQTRPDTGHQDRRLAGEVGAEVAAALSQALARVNEILHSGRVGRHSLGALRDEIEHARRIAILGQQVSRLAGGQVQQLPETLELPAVLHEVLRQRAGVIAARGLSVRQRLRPATLSVDASLLSALLESLLDWAFEHCALAELALATEVNTWPVHAVLRCEFAWRAPDEAGGAGPSGAASSGLDTLAWRLVEQAAAAMGVGLQREETGSRVILRLAFPETARRWPRLVDADEPQEAPPAEAPALAGWQALVLAPSVELQHAVRAALAPLGMQAEYARSASEALARSRRSVQQVLVADEAVPGLEILCRELHAGGSGPALVLIGDLPPGLEVATTGRSEVTRLGRDAVQRELPQALRYALTPR
jgi:hypothetical protein